MRCCSLPISVHTHMSLGSPHVGQISAMLLNYLKNIGVFKTFNTKT
jgi:hypothetical protein